MVLTLTAESKWMDAQKHATALDETKDFEVIQTKDGDSIFFSLGTDHVLYATREIRKSTTGWDKINLTEDISSLFFEKQTVTVKHFRISQNPLNKMKYDLAVVVTSNKQDHLLLSLGNNNTDESWKNGVTWTHVPYSSDGYPAPASIIIDNLVLLTFPSSSAKPMRRSCFVDVRRFPDDPLGPIIRYYINTESGTPKWKQQSPGEDISGTNLKTCLGKQKGVYTVPGIYTLGRILNKVQLMYQAEYNRGEPDTRPSIMRLEVPDGATSIASASDADGNSNLFISSALGLSLYPVGQQKDHGPPKLTISANSLVKSVKELRATTTKSVTTIWGLNSKKDLFYMTCPASKESDIGAWSMPITIVAKVESFAFFTKYHAGSQTLFAQTGPAQITQLTQSVLTSEWSERQIMLPALSYKDIVHFKAHTTHLRVADENNIGKRDVTVSLSATVPVGVFVQNTYYVLDPESPVDVKTDESGAISIIQQTDSITCVCYEASLEDSNSKKLVINPAKAGITKLRDLAAIGDVEVTRTDGKKVHIVTGSNSGEKDIATRYLKRCGEMGLKLPANGTVKKKVANAEAVGLGSSLFVKAGDFFKMVGHAAISGLHQLEFSELEGFIYAIVKIGEASFHTILDCVSAVTRAAQFIFDHLKIWIEDLIAWLGFLFLWKDIARTHKVIRNVVNLLLGKLTSEIGTVANEAGRLFDDARNEMKKLTGVKDPTTSTKHYTKNIQSVCPDIHQPQTHWASNHFKSGYQDSSPIQEPPMPGDDLGSLLKIVVDAVDKEEKVFKDTCNEIKEKLVGKLGEMNMSEFFMTLLEIFSDAFLRSAKNVTLSFMKVLEFLSNLVYDLLNKPIDIPIISYFYEKFISLGDRLTVLDLFCLVLAVPTTILYKSVADVAPFEDDQSTKDLIAAKDWAAFEKLLFPKSVANGDAKNAANGTLAVAAPSATFKKVNSVFQMVQVAANGINVIIMDIQYALTLTKVQGNPVKMTGWWTQFYFIPALGNFIAAVPTFVANLARTGIMKELIYWAVFAGMFKIVFVTAFRFFSRKKFSPDELDTWVTKINPIINMCLALPLGGLLAGSLAFVHEEEIPWLMTGSCAITRFAVATQNLGLFTLAISEKENVILILLSGVLLGVGNDSVFASAATQIFGIHKYIKAK